MIVNAILKAKRDSIERCIILFDQLIKTNAACVDVSHVCKSCAIDDVK